MFSKLIINTPLGPLAAVSDRSHLHLLGFEDSPKTQKTLGQFGSNFSNDSLAPIRKIRDELGQFFAGELVTFSVPLAFSGTPFQESVWLALRDIEYGTTCSYQELAQSVGRPKAYRAAASANGANRFVIVVPCHRVIGSDGGLGGFSCGLERKVWLLEHERNSLTRRMTRGS